MRDDSHVSQSWQQSPEAYVELRDALQEAKAENRPLVRFRGRYVEVDYAGDMLEYLRTELGIQEA